MLARALEMLPGRRRFNIQDLIRFAQDCALAAIGPVSVSSAAWPRVERCGQRAVLPRETEMLFSDAKKSVETRVAEVKAL
jgi:hypothetical protein